MSPRIPSRLTLAVRRLQRGFSLIEMMVALTLGLLVSLGIITLFSATGKTNRVQASLARLQENGRFAITRINDDLRMSVGQFCSNSSTDAKLLNFSANGEQAGPRQPNMRVNNFFFPDIGNTPLNGFISPRYFMQGYECDATSCSPATPAAKSPQTTTFPAMGTTAGSRVKGTDVLTIRYQRGTGWPTIACTGGATGTFSVQPSAGDATITPAAPADPDMSFGAGDIALITDCNTTEIFTVKNAVASGKATTYPKVDLVPNDSGVNAPTCFGNFSSNDVRAFNFSKDFITVSYYLKLKANPSPDAPSGSMISSLYRRYGYGAPTLLNPDPREDELVEGVERLDFLYGVEAKDGTISYLTAKDVDLITSCPSLATSEAKCGWRSIRSIEVHMLVNTVDSTFGLTPADSSYRYGGDSSASATMIDGPLPTSTMPVTGIPAGSMLRREFVSLISLRNNTP
jgi:type IV pilus assembly protein PilW